MYRRKIMENVSALQRTSLVKKNQESPSLCGDPIKLCLGPNFIHVETQKKIFF